MRDFFKFFGPIAILLALGFAIASRYINPAPPRQVRIASGAPQGAYAESARRYREILARDGITLEVVTTSGSIENLKLLQAPTGGVDVAFVQGGTAAPDTPGLLSIGSVFIEPLWVFVRDAVPARYVADLAGRRLAVGAEGSGTRVLALQLLRATGIREGPHVLGTGGDEAVQALLKGTVDAAFFVTARPFPQLEPLLRTKQIRLMSFAQADAFAQRFRFLSKVVLPEGRLDLAANIPAADVNLLAPAAALVAREDLHPAIIDRLIQAATEVHGGGQLFTEPGQFPSPRLVDIPLSPDAERYLRSGPTFLRRHLPFWAATMVERFMVMLIPILTLMLPLFRFAPPVYNWQIRRRIYRWYGALRDIEQRVSAVTTAAERAAVLQQLDRIEADVGKVQVPLGYAESHYHLRTH
ncbi:MAG: C4-dicarboxylate ABC transporter substrate-binding protein, partial [Zetaproteobacteria bacterium]